MTTSRLEAFSDGVLAIVITVMVLELKPPSPEDATWHSLIHTSGVGLLTYVLSFVYIGIYWSNHHHLFQLVDDVDGTVLWANLHLLFWLSIVPFTNGWLDESNVDEVPTVVYGLNLLAAAIAYYLLQLAIFRTPSGDRARAALGSDLKGKLSPVLYVVGILLALVNPYAGLVPAVIVALTWLVPDRRVERFLAAERG
ncbi:TMEM175 family protein [Nocardioides panacisoli]|uniref:TMEM175 family protein n=1 Tax=Nocardioides panacisoli TaxID=627624 RepID=A0ABP7IVH8_9ACTN